MLTAQEPKQYGSEAGHWYKPDGSPCHVQPNKSKPGETRPTTLRDARAQFLLPSVSAILGVMAKPGLNQWRDKQIVKACWETDALLKADAPHEEYESLVLKLAEDRMTKARDLGTEIHGAIERFLDHVSTRGIEDTHLVPSFLTHSRHVDAAVAALKELGVWGQPFEAERTFASQLGYGGTCDWISADTIIDFKAINTLSKRYDWPERSAQIAAYQMGVHGKLCRGVNIMICTDEPGTYAIREWSPEELQYGWKLFVCCFDLWKCISKYDPTRTQ